MNDPLKKFVWLNTKTRSQTLLQTKTPPLFVWLRAVVQRKRISLPSYKFSNKSNHFLGLHPTTGKINSIRLVRAQPQPERKKERKKIRDIRSDADDSSSQWFSRCCSDVHKSVCLYLQQHTRVKWHTMNCTQTATPTQKATLIVVTCMSGPLSENGEPPTNRVRQWLRFFFLLFFSLGKSIHRYTNTRNCDFPRAYGTCSWMATGELSSVRMLMGTQCCS